VVRHDPGIPFGKTKYRKALPYLLKDFGNRCAYSMEFVGEKAEVDHFNPNKKSDKIQEYSNLFPASRHCNGAKKATWPSKALQAQGIRFLDCTKEVDYGESIFENPETHHLVGITPAARWHINELDLNAPFLVKKRRDRSLLLYSLSKCPVVAKKPLPEMGPFVELVDVCRELADEMIPEIPPPPPEK
jgi:hypothetical protein